VAAIDVAQEEKEDAMTDATTAEEIRQLARQQRKGLPKCYAPPEMAAWER